MNAVVVGESRDTEVSVASKHQHIMSLVRMFDTPWDTNMFGEFVETLVRTDVDVTPVLANRVWLAMTTPHLPGRHMGMMRKALATSFLASEDPADLAKRWEGDLLGEFYEN